MRTQLRHAFQRSCNMTTPAMNHRSAFIITPPSPSSSLSSLDHSSRTMSNNNNTHMASTYATQGGLSDGCVRIKLNSREKKNKIFRIVRAKEKYEKHSNFYGNRLRVSVNETYIAQLLDTYSDKRTYKPAIKMYMQLREKNLVPSVYSYRKFLFTVGYRGRQTEEAERIFKDMLEIEGDAHKALKTDRYCHNTMMHVYANNLGGLEGYAKARKLFDVMAQSENPFFRPNSFSYFYLLRCFSSRGAKRSAAAAAAADTEGEEGNVEAKDETEKTKQVEAPEKIVLGDASKEVVRQIMAEMLKDNVLLASNRHIKTALERLDMHQELEDVLATVKQELK